MTFKNSVIFKNELKMHLLSYHIYYDHFEQLNILGLEIAISCHVLKCRKSS